ncbi:phosphatidylserine decarboxylase [Elioraea sp.]|uniref:phosphatidylserine decarboxylase n=1 Tax=Elioraea sp. TaxID=2185103 RepID=UPI003F71CDE9
MPPRRKPIYNAATMSLLDTTASVLARPHRAGLPFIASAALVGLVGGFVWSGLLWLGVATALFCAFFFRDPDRAVPTREGLILAPADGRVVAVATVPPPPELALGPEPRVRIATFLSVLDVHVNRAPCAGTVKAIAYHPGKFLNAAEDKASEENERNAIALELPHGRTIAVVQIAGLIARRIVCEIEERQTLRAGQRIGLIRFGSRVDLYLPEGAAPLVAVGQRMVGGETVMADLASDEPARTAERV